MKKKMHLKVVKCLATLCLAIGIFGVCGLNVHAESAAVKNEVKCSLRQTGGSCLR